MTDTQAAISSSVRELLAEIGLPADFVETLHSDSDWSLVIKIHSLIEAAVTHALVVHAGNDEARHVFARLELSNSKTGKLAFANVYLKILSKDRRFIRRFSELRNLLVHDVRNVSFNLNMHFASISSEKKRAFVRDLGYADGGDDKSSEASIGRLHASRTTLGACSFVRRSFCSQYCSCG